LGKLDGKVVVVTGAGRGFGRAIALAMGSAGAKVVAVARNTNELGTLAAEMKSQGQQVLTVPTDLSKPEEIDRLRKAALDAFGRMDVVYNNAAISLWKTFEEMEIADWDFTIDVNLRGYFLVAKSFLDSMKEHHGGSIVNVSSSSAELGFIGEIAYCPSKFGIEGLTQCMALELRPYNIAVNSLNVSALEGKSLKPTGLTEEESSNLPDAVKTNYSDNTELARAFGDAWVFLALQRGNGITGQRFRTKDLAVSLAAEGPEKLVEKYKGKLMRATYQTIDFPKVVRYQTPGGGIKEQRFD